MADSIDIKLVFSNLAATLQHLLADAEVDKAQETEIQATIKQLNDFEGSINDTIDAKIKAAIANIPAPAAGGDASGLDARMTAVEQGLSDLGHIFNGDQGAEPAPEPAADAALAPPTASTEPTPPTNTAT